MVDAVPLDADLAAVNLHVTTAEQPQQPPGTVGDASGLPLAVGRRQTDGRVRRSAVVKRYSDRAFPLGQRVRVYPYLCLGHIVTIAPSGAVVTICTETTGAWRRWLVNR